MTENKPAARGGGRGGGNKPSTSKTVVKKKTTITDYVFHVGSVKQASEFETTSEFIINYISSDIGSALENLQPMDRANKKPKLKTSLATSVEEKSADAQQFGMEFRADYEQWCKRICMYEQDNWIKSYTLIWERCTKALQNKLQSRSDFDSLKNDPIKLLKAVKEHSLNYQENRYGMSIILDSIKAMIDTAAPKRA
eukprot:scaffold100331_cov51-Attheya_sp.AAC.11